MLPGPAVDSAARARALLVAGNLAMAEKDFAAAWPWLEEGVAISRGLGDANRLAGVLAVVGDHMSLHDPLRARSYLDESVTLCRAVGNDWALATALMGLGKLAQQRGDYHEARSRFEESIARFGAAGDDWEVVYPLLNLAAVNGRLGDHTTARAQYEGSLRLFRQMGGHPDTLSALAGLALELLLLGDEDQAAAMLAESLTLSRRLGVTSQAADALEVLAGLLQRRGRPGSAARLYGAAEALRERRDFPRPVTHARRYSAALEVTRVALGEPSFTAAWAAGRALSWDEVVTEAAAALGLPDEAASDTPCDVPG